MNHVLITIYLILIFFKFISYCNDYLVILQCHIKPMAHILWIIYISYLPYN